MYKGTETFQGYEKHAWLLGHLAVIFQDFTEPKWLATCCNKSVVNCFCHDICSLFYVSDIHYKNSCILVVTFTTFSSNYHQFGFTVKACSILIFFYKCAQLPLLTVVSSVGQLDNTSKIQASTLNLAIGLAIRQIDINFGQPEKPWHCKLQQRGCSTDAPIQNW